jgi:hypothetical protein
LLKQFLINFYAGKRFAALRKCTAFENVPEGVRVTILCSI